MKICKDRLISFIRAHFSRANAAHKRFIASATTTHFNDLAMECSQAVTSGIALMEPILEERRGGNAMAYAKPVDELEKLGQIKKREAQQLR